MVGVMSGITLGCVQFFLLRTAVNGITSGQLFKAVLPLLGSLCAPLPLIAVALMAPAWLVSAGIFMGITLPVLTAFTCFRRIVKVRKDHRNG